MSLILSYQDTGSTEIVILAEAKAFMRVTFNDDDSVITEMIKASRQVCESWANRPFTPKTVKVMIESYDSFSKPLPYGPATITLVESIDDFGNPTAVASTDYKYRNGVIYLPWGVNEISYTVAPVVTSAMKEAVMMEVAQRYLNRGENTNDFPTGLSEGAKAILDRIAIPAI